LMIRKGRKLVAGAVKYGNGPESRRRNRPTRSRPTGCTGTGGLRRAKAENSGHRQGRPRHCRTRETWLSPVRGRRQTPGSRNTASFELSGLFVPPGVGDASIRRRSTSPPQRPWQRWTNARGLGGGPAPPGPPPRASHQQVGGQSAESPKVACRAPARSPRPRRATRAKPPRHRDDLANGDPHKRAASGVGLRRREFAFPVTNMDEDASARTKMAKGAR